METLFSNLDDLIRMSKEKAEKNLRDCVANIKTDFAGMMKILSIYHPLEVLKLTAWEARRKSAKTDVFTRTTLNLMPFLIQSLVSSNLYDARRISQNRNIKPKDWSRLVSLTEAVTRKLIKYIDYLTVIQIHSGIISRSDANLYREYLGVLYFPPFETKERIEACNLTFQAAMSSVEGLVREKFCATSDEISKGFKDIAEDALVNIDNLIRDVQIFKSEVMLKMAQRREEGKDLYLSEEALTKKIISENNWQGRSLSLAGKRDDFDLFRPEFVTDLPKSVYDAISVELGSVDIYKILLEGYWPASLKPYLKFGEFYFSFIGKHLVSCGNRILMDTLNIYDAPTRASQVACSEIFTATDVVDVYSFEGNKIDLIMLPSLTEANPDTNPVHFANKLMQREEERKAKRQLGHVLLFVDPDSTDELQKIDENSYITSTAFLFASAKDKESRRKFLSTMFGVLDLPESEKTFAESIEDDYFLSQEAENIPDPDDDISDEYEYALSEDEEDAVIEAKDIKFEEANPELVSDKYEEENLDSLRETYELTEEILEKDEKNTITLSGFAKEIDYDDFDDEDELDEDEDFDVSSEDDEFYNEAEAIDEYISEEITEESLEEIITDKEGQLDFLNLLDDEPAKDEFGYEQEVDYETASEEIKEEVEEVEAEEPAEEISEDSIEETSEIEDIEESAFADEVEAEETEDLETEDSSEVIEDVVTFASDPAFADEVEEEDVEDLVTTDGIAPEEFIEDEVAEESTEEPEEETLEEAIEEVTEEVESNSDSVSEEVFTGDEEEVSLDEDEDDEELPYVNEIEALAMEDDSEPAEDVVEVPLFSESEEECIKHTEALKEAYKDDPLFTELSFEDDEAEEEKTEVIIEEPVEETPEEVAEEIPEPVVEEPPVEEAAPKLSWAQSMFGDILGFGVEESSNEETPAEPVVEAEEESVAEEPGISEEPEPTVEAIEEETPTEAEEKTAEEPSEELVEEPEEEAVEPEPEPEEKPYYVGEDGSTLTRDKDGTFILRGHASTVEELMLPADEKIDDAYVETLDGILLKIKNALKNSNSIFLSFVEEVDEEVISHLHSVFSDSWQKQQQDHKDKIFSIFDYSLTVLLARNPIRDDLRLSELLNNAGAVMYSKKKDEWNALILHINDEYEVETAIERHITKNTFSAFDWKRVMNIGEQLLSRGRN